MYYEWNRIWRNFIGLNLVDVIFEPKRGKQVVRFSFILWKGIFVESLPFCRLPFRAPNSNADPVPSFTPVSCWVDLDRENFKSCLDPSQLRKSPTTANSNEQTRRFQVTCQLAVNSIVNCKTFFLPVDFIAFHSSSASLDVHNALKPGLVRVTGAAVEKEFAQFLFSLLLEILDACLVSAVFYCTSLGFLLILLVSSTVWFCETSKSYQRRNKIWRWSPPICPSTMLVLMKKEALNSCLPLQTLI